MHASKTALFLALTLPVVLQLACGFLTGQTAPDTAATLDSLYTASALTIEARLTHSNFTATPGLPPPTVTGSLPFALKTSTPVIVSPAPVTRCDAATFVSDISYPDGTMVLRGTSFTKTWRLRNSGSCTWTTSYALVFAGGAAMEGPTSAALPHSVAPGQTVDLSVRLRAPESSGEYQGFWKLRSSGGQLFGIGANATTAFWVDIRVQGRTHVAYDFAANSCDADWENNVATLPCPGEEGDEAGYVLRLSHPRLEDGTSQDEAGLLMVPKDTTNGFISGQFPAFVIETGDHFQADVYCRYGATRCNVTVRLDYRSGGQVRTLGTWIEVYEGKYYPIDLDLSALAGRSVKFILVVGANGAFREDEAIWLAPQVLRRGAPPAPTASPTATRTSTATATPTSSATPTSTATSSP
jgi:hypothetical protein